MTGETAKNRDAVIEGEDKQRKSAFQSEREGSEKETVQDICPSD